MDVNRILMDQQRRARPVAFADDFRARTLLDDDEVVRARRAQADVLCREGFAHPMVAIPRALEHALFGEDVEHLIRVRAEHFAHVEGQFERPAFEVAGEDVKVVRVDQPTLDAAFEDEIRVGDDVLVERVRGGNHHGERGLLVPARSPKLLPEAGECTGVAGDHARAQSTNIYTELQGVRGDDAAYAAVAQPTLDRAPFIRQIAAAIPGNAFAIARFVAQRFAQVRQQQLDPRPARGEDDRLHLRLDQPRRHIARRL